MENLINNEKEYKEINDLLQDDISILLNKCSNILEQYDMLEQVYNTREELISYEYEYNKQNSYEVEEIFERISQIQDFVKTEMDIEFALSNISTIY